MECCIHCESVTKETLLILESSKVDKLKAFSTKWITTNKQPETSLGQNFLNKLDLVVQQDQDLSQEYYCHNSCYLRFAAESKFQRAAASKRKVSWQQLYLL